MRLDTFTHDTLLIGESLDAGEAVLQKGQNLKRGSVLGKVLFSVPSQGTLTGSGDGVLADVNAGRKCRVGTYRAIVSSVNEEFSVFSVAGPSGEILGSVLVKEIEGNSGVFKSSALSFRITAGSSAFDATTVFTVDVSEGSGESVVVDRDNVDGSNVPSSILAEDVDATMSAVTAQVYLRGVFNERALVFGGDDTINHFRDDLRAIGIDTALTYRAGPSLTRPQSTLSAAERLFLAENVDAAETAVKAPAYTRGVFDQRMLSFGGDDTINHHRYELWELGIVSVQKEAFGVSRNLVA